MAELLMAASRILQFDRFELDPYHRTLKVDGERMAIPTQLLSALIYLIRRRGTDVSRKELRRALYRRESIDTDAALDGCVLALRRLLGDNGRPRFILTKPRAGYRFIGVLKGEGVVEGEAQARGPTLRLLAVKLPPLGRHRAAGKHHPCGGYDDGMPRTRRGRSSHWPSMAARLPWRRFKA